MTQRRQLGYWETTCKYGHDLFAGSGNVAGLVEISGLSLDNQLLLDALSLLYKRHPSLQASFFDQFHQYYVVYRQNLQDLPFEITANPSWEAVIEEQMHKQFEVSSCLWRACINQTPNATQLIFVTHHAIADGLSLMVLLQEWLSIYEQLNLSIEPNLTPLSFLPPIEDMLMEKNSWQRFIENKQKNQTTNLPPWQFHQVIPVTERRTRILYRTLPPAVFAALKMQCKKNQVTINSALNAALLLAIQRHREQPLHTTLHTPVNLRRYTTHPLSNEHIGCFISMVMTEHKLQEHPDFWQLAQMYQQQLKERIPELGFCPNDFDIAEFDLRELMLLFDMVTSSKRKYFTCGFGISNLGTLPLDSNLSLVPTKFMFCTNRVVGDFVIFLNCLTYQNTLHLGFCYTEPLVEQSWVLNVIEDFQVILLEQVAIHVESAEMV